MQKQPIRNTRARVFVVIAAACSSLLMFGVFTGCPSPTGSSDPLPAAPVTYTISLAKTGFTASQQAGDDGDVQAGVAWPSPRFVNNGDDTITDKLTGLMWERAPTSTTYTWANAFTRIAALNTNAAAGSPLGGHTDWRLPNSREIMSLFNLGVSDNAAWLNGQGFNGIAANTYWWTSTTAAYSGGGTGTEAYRCHFSAYLSSPNPKTGTSNVLGVRSAETGTVSLPRTGQTTSYNAGDDGDLQLGKAWPSPRFVDHGNGTVTDMLTGLMWEKSPSTDNYSGQWADAITVRIAALNTTAAAGAPLGGYTDWRLPNVLELASLHNPASPFDLNADFNLAWLAGQGLAVKLNAGATDYWTSTSQAGNPANGAVYIRLHTGEISTSAGKNNILYVIGVRAGR